MKWTADDVLEANPPQPDQSRSKLQRIMSLAQANLDLIAEVADEIERRPMNHVAALFQLPYAVRIAPGWHRVPSATAGVHIELKCEVCRVAISLADEFLLVRESDDGAQAGPLVTQCVALFPIWGNRARFHDKYLTHVDIGRGDNPIIIPQRDSWVDNRPLTLRDYGHNLAGSLLKRVIPILRCFLPAYSIVSLSEAPVPQRVYAYMAMTAPGHIVFAGETISIVRALLESLADKPTVATVESDQLAAAMRTRYREFGQFETQLFALERLRLRGETALASIATLSLLEWLLNTFVRAKGGRERNLASVLHDPLVTFFGVEEKAFIDEVRQKRNRVVHGAPPQRQSLTIGGMQAGRELDGMASAIPTEDVRRVIKLVFQGFRAVNLSGVREVG